MTRVTLGELAGVVYSAGKVFDDLRTGRIDTENFLRSGDTSGVTSRSDLALLEDLRDAAMFILEADTATLDAEFVCALNGQLTRSAALHPGQFRTEEQQIGVNTRHGRHTPPAITGSQLQDLIDAAVDVDNPSESALDLFVSIARAQPFEDGNKRTALFAANFHLIQANSKTLLFIPGAERDEQLAKQFNDLLARTYLTGDRSGVKDLLRSSGLRPITLTGQGSEEEAHVDQLSPQTPPPAAPGGPTMRM